MMSDCNRAQVLIAGGGFAALEAAVALCELAADRVDVTLISPSETFSYRPAAPVEAFGAGPPRRYDLTAIATDLGAAHRRDRLESVGTRQRWVRLASGARLQFDHLILALGARATSGVSGALLFRDQRDGPAFRRILRQVDGGIIHRLVFVLPSGCSWSLPLYELALLTGTRVQRKALNTEITLVSPEPAPLEVYGAQASSLVSGLLAERGIRFVGSATATRVRRDGALMIESGETIDADRVLAVPLLRVPRIGGVPANAFGFVPVDQAGRVQGMTAVYAAGDMTSFPIKQGGLAAQQADRIAHLITVSLGLPAEEPPAAHVLRSQLVGGEQPVFLRTELDDAGRPITTTLDHAELAGYAEFTKVFGRHLSTYLERLPAPSGATV
jgi:sulfide:quinone oxidoreductase